MSIVWGEGPKPSSVMVVGEAPRQEDAYNERPFTGAIGREQDLFFQLNGMHRARTYLTYIVKEFKEGDSTKSDIQVWEPVLADEIQDVRPEFILSVGRSATRWFLGDVDMDAVHGTPHRSEKAPGVTVIPCYDPGFGLYDPDAKGVVYHDYKQAANIIKGRIPRDPVVDTILHPSYYVVDDPRRLRIELESLADPILALDTEGIPEDPWSIQVSGNPGTGLVLLRKSPFFAELVAVLQRWADQVDPLFIVHNTMYDLAMTRAMRFELVHRRLYDTMVAAYLLRLEPQSLKHLARRHCGMTMMEYREMIGSAADDKRKDWIWRAIEIGEKRGWPAPEPRLIVENDNTTRVYKPQPIQKRLEKIILDWGQAEDNLAQHGFLRVKLDNKEDFDVEKRWKAVDGVLRKMVEDELGPFPDATLDDVPLERAVRYSGRDPDATLRVYHRINPMVTAADLDSRMQLIMSNLPSIEEMQSTGLIADRGAFTTLVEKMNDEMYTLCHHLSRQFWGGQPINPNSQDQVAALMRTRGLQGVKRSKKTKKMSTAKKSIEHLRHTDDAMALVMDWRERAKTRDSFGGPILERMPEGAQRAPICCNIRVTRVSSSRLSATDPPLLAIPVRHELGIAVRRGFVAPTAEDLVTHYGVSPDDAGDCYLGTWDLSQIEMRVMAHKSGDPTLIRFMHERRDIHCETAIKIFGLTDSVKPEKDRNGKWVYPGLKKKEQRDPTKRAGFGVITGIQGPGLLDQLRMMGCTGWDEESCDELITEWFKVYPGVLAFLEACRTECRQNGYVRDMGGMYRYLPGIWSRDSRIRAEAERQSHSHIIQGSAQWMLQRAMSWLKPEIRDLRESTGMWVRWLLQVHDELLFGFDQRLAYIMNDLVLRGLTQASIAGLDFQVPVEASGSYQGLTWGDLEK